MLLLGTKEIINDPEPTERPKFIEDMNEAELASAVSNSIDCYCEINFKS